MNDITETKPAKPSRIFIGSSGDMFGEWVRTKPIKHILNISAAYPQHTYLFLTKNPIRYKEFKYSNNIWLGTTVDYRNAKHRLDDLRSAKELNSNIHIFASFEPLLEPLHLNEENLSKLDWVIIGGLTGRFSSLIIKELLNNHDKNTRCKIQRQYLSQQSIDALFPGGINKYEQEYNHAPADDWILPIVSICKRLNIPVFIKENAQYKSTIQEFPKEKWKMNDVSI